VATQLAIQTANNMAIAPPAPAAADATGNYVTPNGGGLTHLVLRVANGGTAAVNVVVDDPTSATPVGATAWNPDLTVAVPAGAQRYVVITNIARFRDPATGRINWTYSATPTGVTVEVIGA
jgi:hypothetical protein